VNKNLLLKWSDNNKKLKKTGTVSFNLPAIQACPKAGACAAVCYATQGAYVYPQVKAARLFNFNLAQFQPTYLEQALVHDLNLIKQKSIRVHDSGDFFSQEYLDIWCRVMLQFPHKSFYAYTKSLHLNWNLAPKNFVRIQSQGGKLDHLIDYSKPHARIFATDEGRQQAGYCDGNINDSPAQRGEILIGLTYHGVKLLTEAQHKTFA
jgi:hypothetical protein